MEERAAVLVTDLRRLVLSWVSWPALGGLIAGTGATLVAGRFLQPLLFDVSTHDTRAFLVGGVTLATLIAALVPLRRAGRVDAVRLLRSE